MRPNALSTLLLAVLLFAGCLQAPAAPEAVEPAEGGAGSGELPAQTAVPVFGAAAEVTRSHTAEPGLAVGPDGRAFVNVWTSVFSALAADAAYSGKTTPFEAWGDTDLAVDEHGVVHMVGMPLGQNPGYLPYVRSWDNGTTWEAPQELGNGERVDRPWITVAPGGLVVVTWNEYGARENLVRISRDGGDTWEPPITLPGPFLNIPGPAAVHGDLILQPRTLGSDLHLARSTDAGATWETLKGPRIGARSHTFATLAFDEEGRAYLAAATSSDALVENPVVRVWRSDDGGATWSEPVRVSPPGSTAIFPWVVAGAPGRVAVAYYENGLGTPPRSPAGVWHVGIAVTTTADEDTPEWLASRVQERPIRVGAICTDGAGCTGSDWSLKDYFEMALTPEGRPAVAWAEDNELFADPTNPSLRVMVAAAGSGWRAWGPSAS